MENPQEEILSLRNALEKHEELYRIKNAPVISDYEYDRLKRQLEELEKKYPEFKEENSITQKVGDDHIKGFESADHLEPMLSLDNAFSEEEINAFDQRLKKVLSIPLDEQLEYIIEPKIDGLSISLVYENGVFVRALTRGNGQRGDIVTDNILLTSSFPKKIDALKNISVIEIRGESFITKKEFERINELKKQEALEKISQTNLNLSDEEIAQKQKKITLFANPRNLASGTLKSLDKDLIKDRKLSIGSYAIGFVSENIFEKQEEIGEAFKSWHIPTISLQFKALGTKQAFEKILYLQNNRDSFDYQIDGAVIKLNDISLQKKASFTQKSPRWATAYKFPAQKKETILKDITVQVGRTGVLTPVAELEGVHLDGSFVSRATLHNFDELSAKDIRIGDSVLIEKAGDVIPSVIKVILEKRKQDAVKYTAPTCCPVCNFPVEKENGQVALRCTNPFCPAQIVRSLIYFCSKECMDIENMGEATVSNLHSQGIINTIDDIYKISYEDIFETGKEKSTKNIINAIEKSKKNPLWRLVNALGINGIGEKSSKDLAKNFKSIDKLILAKEDDFLAVYGIGEKTAKALVEFFENEKNLKILENLKFFGVNFEDFSSQTNDTNLQQSNNFFFGKTFVLTGTLETLKRDKAKEIIESFGGKTSSSISEKTDYLLAGQKAGSKLDKAASLGVKILDENSFLQNLPNILKDKNAIVLENVEPRQGELF